MLTLQLWFGVVMFVLLSSLASTFVVGLLSLVLRDRSIAVSSVAMMILLFVLLSIEIVV